MTEDDITSIIERHNFWESKAGQFTRSHLNVKLRNQARRYLKWCEKHDVDPMLFLDAQHSYRISIGSKVLDLGFLPSKRALEHWRRWAEGAQLRQVTDDRLTQALARRPPEFRKVRPHQEQFKSRYTGRESLCAIYQEHTGGFNQESRYCRACPAQASCIESGKRRS